MSISMDTNSLAQQIKDVTLNAVNTVKEAVVGEASPADDKHRVFVGNLKPETTEDELRTLFSQAGEIINVSLPTRRQHKSRKGAEPSGIAFIGYTSDADAQKAVETINGKSLGDRELNVAIARPLTEKKPKSKPTTNAGTTDSTNEATEGTAATSGAEKKKRTKKPKAKKATNGDAAADTTGDEAAASPSSTAKGTEAAPKPRTPRAPREKGPPSDGIPSKTTLFVAGLDHKTTDAELKQLFSNFSPTSAHVALRPIPKFVIKRLAEKGEQRLSRGFGFVSFADQSAQTSALKAMDGHTVGDRQLAVKVAVDSQERSEQNATSQAGATQTASA